MQIKIYDHTLTPLTTLFISDVENVQYTNSLYNSGTASFVVEAKNKKATANNLRQYNRVKIFDGNVCVFFGFITECSYDLNTVGIRIEHISEILQNRSTGGSFSASGTISTVLTNLLSQVNSVANTGISLGNVANIAGIYSKTYNSGESVKEILDDLLQVYQYYIDNEGKLHANTLLGNDLSQTIKLRYDINQTQLGNNITDFKVKETSSQLFTKITAFSDSYPTQTVQDTALQAKYGVVEVSRKYYQVYSTGEVIDKATADLKGSSYTPEITLVSGYKDAFEVTDRVGVRLYNGIVDLTETYQVIEKSVTFIGGEKKVSIKLNDRQKNLIDYIVEQRKKIKLLEL